MCYNITQGNKLFVINDIFHVLDVYEIFNLFRFTYSSYFRIHINSPNFHCNWRNGIIVHTTQTILYDYYMIYMMIQSKVRLATFLKLLKCNKFVIMKNK